MRRNVAKAIAIRNPYVAALASMKNCLQLVVDFMYGTKERTRFTLAFAIGLAVLGLVIFSSELQASLQSCAI